MADIDVLDKVGLSDSYLQNLIIEACKSAGIEPEEISRVIIAPKDTAYIVNLVTKVPIK
jgi:hypothetical protein